MSTPARPSPPGGVVAVPERLAEQALVVTADVSRRVLNELSAAAFVLDRNLRVVVAEGSDLIANGYDPAAVVGALVKDVVPAAAFQLLEGPYQAALRGVASDFDYVSPDGGGFYRVRVRPAAGDDGQILGAVGVSVDLSATRSLQVQLMHIRDLIDVGSCVYERRSGWTCDEDLVRLWGQSRVVDPVDFAARVVVPEDREQVTTAWRAILATGGNGEFGYRMRHPETGRVRNIHCVCTATVDENGTLVRAHCTHVDVTGLIAAGVERERVIADAAAERTALLKRVGELLLSPGREIQDIAQRAVDLASVALGQGCVLRVLSPDQTRIDTFAVAHGDESGRQRLLALLDHESGRPVDLAAVLGDEQGRRRADQLVAPLRSQGAVLGVFSSYRDAGSADFDASDEDFVQVLADQLGAMIDGRRARERVAREEAARRIVDDRLRDLAADQRDLALQLDRAESRERALLADAVHDEPLQAIIAALLRLDIVRSGLPEPAGRTVDDVTRMLEGAVEQLRKMIVTLTPPNMGAGLRAALEQLASGIFVGTPTTWQVAGPAHVQLDPKAKETVYRIVREAMMNTRKHARADTVRIDIREDDRVVRIELVDDGIGARSLDAGPGHLGLASMRARAAAASSSLDVISRPGHGTSVRLVVPVRSGGAPPDASASPGAPASVSGRPAEGPAW